MDFTPAALPVVSIPATAGFQLAETAVFESGFVTLASSIYAYEGNPALIFLNALESKWEKSLLIDREQALPGEYIAIARKAMDKDKWLIGAMTEEKRTTSLSLDFLGEGEYHILLFCDNAQGSEVEYKEMLVTKDTVIKEDLMKNGGLAAIISKEPIALREDTFDYYEMETADLSGDAVITVNSFASGLKQVNLGYGSENQAMVKIHAEEEGAYMMYVYYKAGSERQFSYQVNEETAIRTEKVCSGMNSIARYTCYINLKKGDNRISFYNENGNFVGLDRLAVSKEKQENVQVTVSSENMIETKEGTQYHYFVYPAKEAQTNAVKEPDGYIGWLGGNSTSYLEFKINAEKKGGYMLKLGYMTGDNRSVVLSINKGEGKSYSCESTGGYGLDSLDYQFIPVSLEKGKNSIRISNSNGYCPNIYSLGVSREQIEIPIEAGMVITKNGRKFKVIEVNKKKGTVAFCGIENKKQEIIRIPNKITYKGKTFQVTEISANALKKNQNVKKVVIGNQVKKIKKNAFLGCSSLKKIEIISTNLSSIGKNAFSGIHKKAVIKVPSQKRKAYQNLFGNSFSLL